MLITFVNGVHDCNHLLQCKASLHTLCVVAPPIWHRDDLSRTEDDEDEQHSNVEAGIECSSHEIVVTFPSLKAAPIKPEHADVADDETGYVPGGEISVKLGNTSTKYSYIPCEESVCF